MIRIDTDVPEIIVEIEEKEYPLAARTVDVMDKLAEAERANAGKPAYKLWLAELQILLGKNACRELFCAGKAENVDRLQMIYSGVARAFKHTEDAVAAQDREKNLEDVATAFAPVNEMLRNLRALDREKAPEGNIRQIPRI